MITIRSFHKRLQYVAVLKKIDQKDIVRALKKGRSTVSKWWRGEITPGPTNTRLLAEFFGCDTEWLADGTGEMFSETEMISSDARTPLSENKLQVNQTEPRNQKEDINLTDMVSKTMEILQSNTIYKPALAANIRAFHKAVAQENEMELVRQELAETREDIKNMIERMERMEQLLLQSNITFPEKKSTGTDS